MTRLSQIRRAGTPGEEIDSPVPPLTEQEKKCARAVVRRYCQVMRVPGEERQLLAVLGLEEEQ